MKIKTLLLNALVTIPNEQGEEKIQKAYDKDEPQIDYESLGILRPKGEVERDSEGNIILDEEDFEEATVPVFIPINNIASYVATLEGTTRVYTKSNVAYDVVEDVFEIDSYLEYEQMSWLDKKFSVFQSFLRRIKYKIKGKKQVNLQEILEKPEYKQ